MKPTIQYNKYCTNEKINKIKKHNYNGQYVHVTNQQATYITVKKFAVSCQHLKPFVISVCLIFQSYILKAIKLVISFDTVNLWT